MTEVISCLTLNKKYDIIYIMKNKTEKNIIPNSVKIGYVNYEFDFWPDTFASTEEAQGEFFQSQGKIGLKSSTLDSIHGVNTVLHEIMHGIVYQYGLVEHLGDKEEVTVNKITNGLTTIVVDKPWFIDYIHGLVKT